MIYLFFVRMKKKTNKTKQNLVLNALQENNNF